MKRIKTLLLLTVLMMVCSTASAQKMKFGKPSQKDWTMAAWGEVPDAEAVVLHKSVKVTYALMSNFRAYDSTDATVSTDNYAHGGVNILVDERLTTLTYDVLMRTKILKDSGVGYANVDIVYYHDAQDLEQRDEFYSFSVVVSNVVNGNIEQIRISKESESDDRISIKDEQIDEHYAVRHVRVNDIKAGSIVDYKYQLFSNRYTFLYDWQMQENIPVMYSRCEMDVPAFLVFNMQVPLHPMVSKKVIPGVINLPQEISDLQAPKRCMSNNYKIEAHDILPLSRDMQRINAGIDVTDLRNAMTIRPTLTAKKGAKDALLPAGRRPIMLHP